MHPMNFLNALLAEPYKILRNSIFYMPSMHLLNALLEELSESLVILVLLELTTEFFYALYAYAQFPPGGALQNSSEIMSATIPLMHSLTSKVFSNLEFFL